MTASTQEIGLQNLTKLETWLSSCESLPGRGGRVNISAVALGAGVDRQLLYRPEAREMIAQAVQQKGLSMLVAEKECPSGDPARASQPATGQMPRLISARSRRKLGEAAAGRGLSGRPLAAFAGDACLGG